MHYAVTLVLSEALTGRDSSSSTSAKAKTKLSHIDWSTVLLMTHNHNRMNLVRSPHQSRAINQNQTALIIRQVSNQRCRCLHAFIATTQLFVILAHTLPAPHGFLRPAYMPPWPSLLTCLTHAPCLGPGEQAHPEKSRNARCC
jgi:hypothetical protein